MHSCLPNSYSYCNTLQGARVRGSPRACAESPFLHLSPLTPSWQIPQQATRSGKADGEPHGRGRTPPHVHMYRGRTSSAAPRLAVPRLPSALKPTPGAPLEPGPRVPASPAPPQPPCPRQPTPSGHRPHPYAAPGARTRSLTWVLLRSHFSRGLAGLSAAGSRPALSLTVTLS